jgi:hypothetical protein
MPLLGQRFRAAIDGDSTTAPDLLPPAGPAPAWPYHLAAFGGGVFGVGALLMVFVLAGQGRSAAAGLLSLLLMAGGSALLAVGWIGTLKHGHGGNGAILGSLAIPAAIVFLYANRNNWAMVETRATVLAASLGAFALGHVFARTATVTRIAAAIALAGVVIAFANNDGGAGDGTRAVLAVISFGSLAVVGLSISLTVPGLRRRAE